MPTALPLPEEVTRAAFRGGDRRARGGHGLGERAGSNRQCAASTSAPTFLRRPFTSKGSGYEEGAPFPWIVSDFGLVDAIESGIVKIPRVPVDDNTGALIPKYFRLWEAINQALPASERQTARRRAKPESVLREAEGALATLASEWKKTFDEFQRSGSPVPPVMIVVCDNTDLVQAGSRAHCRGNVLPELANGSNGEVTFRIDTKLLAEAETAMEGETKAEAAERLRKVVDTIGSWNGRAKAILQGNTSGVWCRSGC
jgi:type III restriction enzyme